MTTKRRTSSRSYIAECITYHREQAGFSKARLARAVRCSPSFISQVESGVKLPSYDFGYRVARALGFSGPEDLTRFGPDAKFTKTDGRAERSVRLVPAYDERPVNARLVTPRSTEGANHQEREEVHGIEQGTTPTERLRAPGAGVRGERVGADADHETVAGPAGGSTRREDQGETRGHTRAGEAGRTADATGPAARAKRRLVAAPGRRRRDGNT